MKLRSSRTIAPPSRNGDAAAGSSAQNTEPEPKPESDAPPVQTVQCDEQFPVDNVDNNLHYDSPADLDDADFDLSAEVFDLNELPNFDHIERHVEGSNRKRKKRLSSKKRTGRSKKHSEPIDESDFEDEIEFHDFIEPVVKVPVVKNKRKSKKDKAPLLWEIWEKEDSKWLDEHMNEDIDLNQKNGIADEIIEAPKELVLPLLRYQKEWLGWALKQEESVIKGGILADEMGMGKTLQAIALVLAKREMIRAIGEAYIPSVPSTSNELPFINCTLVICPVVAVSQWLNEIQRFTLQGSTKVLVYHGANRGRSMDHFSGYDFVLTTYSTVESEYRRFVLPPKQRCKWCGKAYAERQMATHEKYFCGPDAIRTERQSKQDKKQKKLPAKMLKKAESSDSIQNEIEKGDDEKGSSKKSGRKCKPLKMINLLTSKKSSKPIMELYILSLCSAMVFPLPVDFSLLVAFLGSYLAGFSCHFVDLSNLFTS